jgi:hypothetical protein
MSTVSVLKTFELKLFRIVNLHARPLPGDDPDLLPA